MLTNILNLSLLSLLLPISAYAGHANPLLNRHHDLAKRADGHVDLFKRFSGARMSYYDVETGNAGSCGKFHVNSDFTVAVSASQMNSGLCFKSIRISYGGKTTTASISDTCPGCPYGGLDLTEGLFTFFAPHSVGIIYAEWEFADAAPAAPVVPKTTTTPVWVAPTTTKKTTPVWVAPTTTPKPTPTTTWTPPPTTSAKPSSTYVPPTSSSVVVSSAKPSSSKVSSSAKSSPVIASTSVNYTSGAAAGLAVPTGTVNRTAGSAENLADLYQVFIQVGGVAAAANNI